MVSAFLPTNQMIESWLRKPGIPGKLHLGKFDLLFVDMKSAVRYTDRFRQCVLILRGKSFSGHLTLALHWKFPCLFFLGLAMFMGTALCQDQAAQSNLTARTLYYNPGPDETPAAAKHTVREPRPAAKAPSQPPSSESMQTVSNEARSNAMTPVTHLGVRYNLVLVSDNGDEHPTDPDSVFHQGDCLSLRVEANHDGYLYVIQHGSTGKWDVLLPSAAMSEERNFIRARTVAKIPENYCFSMDATPGVEHLFLIFSRNQEDLDELNSAIRGQKSSASGEGGEHNTQPSPPRPSSMEQVALLHYGLQGRDLTVKKIAKPVQAGDPVDAVYVVNTTNTPSDHVVTEIQLKHQ